MVDQKKHPQGSFQIPNPMNDVKPVNNCPICGSSVFNYLKRETALIKAPGKCRVVKCRGCGFMYLYSDEYGNLT